LKIKYVLFDLDGTLTNPKEGITKCVQYALRKFGIERECEELEEFIGPPLKEHFMQYASLSDEEGVKAVEYYRERYAPIGLFENGVYDGILELLKNLKKAGCILAIATSKPWIYAQKICDKYGISEYITYLAGSELDGRNTDKAAVVRIAMEKIGAKKEETVLIGDRVHDANGALETSIGFVGVNYGYATQGEFDGCTALGFADTPAELWTLLGEYIG